MLEKPYDAAKEAEFKAYLESIGDSIVLVSDGEIVKVHVHTNHPGLAFEKGLTFGSLTRMKVDNMREEHQERVIANAEKAAKEQAEKDEPKKKYGFISVSAGEGLSEIFKSLGVDYIIEGGQTMNPSTEDMLNAIDKVNAENVFIFPNNSNIILAANQAQTLTEDKDVLGGCLLWGKLQMVKMPWIDRKASATDCSQRHCNAADGRCRFYGGGTSPLSAHPDDHSQWIR